MRRAFTLLEIAIALTVLGILYTAVIPQVSGLLDSIHVRGAAMEIQSLFAAARHTAIARGAMTSVDVDPARDMLSITVNGDTTRTHDPGKDHGVSLSATRIHMSYAPTGMGYGAANLSLVIRRNAAVETVFVSRLGRVRLSR
jgi:prepilin-type N-terminal cleavage/methylation domain-containing protein